MPENESIQGNENNVGTRATEQVNEVKETPFEIGPFNKAFQTTFEDESSLKQALENAKKYHEITPEYQKAQEQAKKYNDILEYYDPMKVFGDEETYSLIELRKKFPDQDIGLISKIRDEGFHAMSDLDKLVLADKLKVKSNVPDNIRRKGILDRLGIESDDVSEWTDADHYKIASALSDSIPILDGYRKFKPDPKVFDLALEKENFEKAKAEKRLQLSQKAKPFAESLLNNYKGPKAYIKDQKGEINEIFSYDVDPTVKSQFIGTLTEAMADNGMEPNEENLKQAMAYVDNHFKILNFDKIVTAAIKHGQSISLEKMHNEIHTDKPVNTKEAPEITEKQEMTIKERVRQGNWRK